MKRLSMLVAVIFGLLGPHSANAACTARRFVFEGAADGDLKIVKDCIKKEKTDVNIIEEGYTALEAALETYANPDVIKYLLKVPGISVHIYANGQTPLLSVAQLSPQEEDTALENELIDFAKTIINKGADVNARSQQSGYTSLIYVANHHTPYAIKLAKLLIAAGADVNAVDTHFKHTALDYVNSHLAYAPTDKYTLDLRDLLLQHSALTGKQVREHQGK